LQDVGKKRLRCLCNHGIAGKCVIGKSVVPYVEFRDVDVDAKFTEFVDKLSEPCGVMRIFRLQMTLQADHARGLAAGRLGGQLGPEVVEWRGLELDLDVRVLLSDQVGDVQPSVLFHVRTGPHKPVERHGSTGRAGRAARIAGVAAAGSEQDGGRRHRQGFCEP